MNRVCGQVLAGLMVAACGGSLVSACTHDDSTMFVRDVLFGQPVAAGQSCSFTSDPTQPFIVSGLLDVALRTDYLATFLVGNQMVPEGNPATPTTETSFIEVQGAVVRITDVDGNQLTTFTTTAGTSIPPAVGSTPSYSPVLGIEILDPTTVASIPVAIGNMRRLITYTRFFGRTLGGQTVESNEFEFPVDLCRTCLISFSSTDDDPAPSLPQPNCLAGGTNTSASTLPVPCAIGEESPVDCSVCASTLGACQVPPGAVVTPVVDAGAD